MLFSEINLWLVQSSFSQSRIEKIQLQFKWSSTMLMDQDQFRREGEAAFKIWSIKKENIHALQPAFSK